MHPHPLWEKFPQNGYMNWQFLPLMRGSCSLVYDKDMPEFSPVFSLIPSFKMVKHKSMLSEFAVGSGRLMVCGFNLESDDPACAYMKRVIMEYLAGGEYAPAPEWSPEKLRGRFDAARLGRSGKNMDEGGRPIE